MRFYTAIHNETKGLFLGYTGSDAVYPITQFTDMNDLVCHCTAEQLSAWQTAPETAGVPLAELTLCAPIEHPLQDILCLGVNYADHAKESENFKGGKLNFQRTRAVYFSKRANRTTASNEAVPAHADLVDSLDYEVELAVVLNKDAKNVAKEDVQDYILGYTIINDVSARNVQSAHNQWYFGKSLDGFAPLGPCIVTKDEFEHPLALSVRSYVNGELRQNSNTSLFLTSIADAICELSHGVTLQAGTIIATGTPAGVGMGFTPPKWLKVGDEVVCEIEGIGKLVNTICE